MLDLKRKNYYVAWNTEYELMIYTVPVSGDSVLAADR